MHKLMVISVIAFVAKCVIASVALGAGPLELNPGTTTYDHHPSVSVADDGTTWIAWHTYLDGSDGVVARRINRDGQVGQLHAISDTGTTHGPPTIVADSSEHAWVVWSAKIDDRWRIALREWKDGRWSKRRMLSPLGSDSIFPTAIAFGGSLVVAWSERADDAFTIRGCVIADEFLQQYEISNGDKDAYRPTLVQHNYQIWAFWDQYDQPNYSVYARELLQPASTIEQVSPAGEYCLTPTALSHSTGLHVAWLRKIDVIGGPGVVSQWHTLHAAVRREDHWQPIIDANGKTEAAELTQGLMAQIAPKPIATGGYLGSRAKPMLHASDGRIWLLWERKSDHRGSTPKVPGDLIARQIAADRTWHTPVVLHHGYVDYHVVHAKKRETDSITLVASKLPRQAKRTYERFDASLADAQPFEQERWTGWNPVKLPVESEVTPRREVKIDGKTYKLFWGDMHCHSNLSADAEGETDELNRYARDRARLGVVVFTNNDFYNVPLTQYEYELGNLFAKSHSVAEEFVSLPGYEWTSRIPGVATASLGDSGNWLPPYRNRSYANHRSVIYPPSGGPLVHFTEVGNDIAKLNESVARAGGITLSQHPNFKLSGHPVEVALELTSGWSNYIARNPKLFHGSLNQAAKAGSTRLGFVANGDSHRRAPGLSGALTGIYAEQLTPESIIEALRHRRCFATSGSQIFLDARANGSFMGDEVVTKSRQIPLTLRTIGTRKLTAAVLIRDGTEIHRVKLDGDRDVQLEFVDSDVPQGSHWYYWRVSQEISAPVLPGNLMAAHGHLAWSSPHWVMVE